MLNANELFWLQLLCVFLRLLRRIAVDAGHRAVIFDRFRGVLPNVTGEGTHFYIPWVQKPIIYDVRSNPRNIPVVTPSKGTCNLVFSTSLSDLQTVNITLRLLYRPRVESLPQMYTVGWKLPLTVTHKFSDFGRGL